ncbi:MAG: transporter, partial [Rhodococcus sp. (in: high G+C Gram-positive bacteria)]
MKTFARTVVVLSAVAAMLGIAACGGASTSSKPVDGSWEDIVAAANEEGSVMLYSSQKPANLEALQAAFHAKYPDIKMDFVRGTDPDINPRVETETKIGKGTADVHMLTDTAWIRNAADSGAYSTDLLGPALEAPEFDPAKSVINGRFFLSSAAVFALGWNTDAVPNGLTTPLDVINPEFRGKIGIVNPVGIASYVDMSRHY